MSEAVTNASADLLALVLDAARQISRHDDPAEAARAGHAFSRRMLAFDRSFRATRRDMTRGAIRILSADAPGTGSDHPIGEGESWIIERGLICDLLYAGEARIVDDPTVAADDPAATYLAGMRSMAAIPQFRGGEPIDMVFHLAARPFAFQ